jgi:hypothetical protein
VIAKSLLGAVLALVLSSEQTPEKPRVSASGWIPAYRIPLPPEQYQGPTAAIVFFVEQPAIDSICGGKDQIIACAEIGGGRMILPNPCQARFRGEAYAAIACHEGGHIRGWAHK